MKRRSVDRIYHTLKEMIVHQKLRGELIETRLAQMLGVSRTPVREALRTLEAEGLVVRSEKGQRVAHVLTMADVREIFEIKKLLEPQLVIWAMERGTAEELHRLNTLADRMLKIAAVVGDGQPNDDVVRQWLEIDTHFHELLYLMAGRKKVASIIKTLNAQWQRLKEGMVALQGRIGLSAKEHKTIVEQMLRGDKEQAKEAMLTHLHNVESTVVTILRMAGYPE